MEVIQCFCYKMADLRCDVWLLLASVLLAISAVESSSQYPAPTNLGYTVTTNSCRIEFQITWNKPNTTSNVENYVLSYLTVKYNSSIIVQSKTTSQTEDNTTTQIISIPGSFTTTFFNISANYTNGTLTHQIGSQSETLAATILGTNCTAPTTTSSSNGTMDLTYGMMIAGIVLGSAIGLVIIIYCIFRCCVWRLERKYDQNDLARHQKSGNELFLIGPNILKVHEMELYSSRQELWLRKAANVKEENLMAFQDHQLPISAENFFDHVSSMKFSDNRGFKVEFAKLENIDTSGCSFGNRPYNLAKNRFVNVPTFDKTRVVLLEENRKPESTYINANFVDGLEWPKAYIATQAPLPETIADFWRMVWEKEVTSIVMLMNLTEKGAKNTPSCAKYWPEKTSMECGTIKVTFKEMENYPDYVIRTFAVNLKKHSELRLVRQFQFTTWPVNRTVPVHPTSFVDFVKKVASFRVNDRHPIVVHCSSGNGRTGAFILVDSQIHRIEHQGDINIFYNVDLVREQRFQLVRNLEEYIFIHECILDHLIFKHRVDINARNILEYIARNKELDSNKETGFQIEFNEVTMDITEMNNKSEVARLPQNSSKNRFMKILPYDHTRVKLKSSADGYNYINASYFSSMTRKRSYIVTQNPLEATMFDFWCMIWENISLTIVMLSHSDQDILPYWPDSKEVLKAGQIKVRLASSDKLKNFEIRNLEITHSEHPNSRMVRQYHYKEWPEKTNEASLNAFVDFIVQCRQWHQVSRSKTITVHCKAGTGKSGVFVAINQLIERLNSENVVNVFKTVRKLRQGRTAIVQTLDQYELIYHALATYYKTYHSKDQPQNEVSSVASGSTYQASLYSGNYESVY